MDMWLPVVITALTSVAASSGVWGYIQKRDTTRNAHTRLLLGLAHDRIVTMGLSFVCKGWVHKDEYHDFVKYLYQPYSEFGGNGLADKVMAEVAKLPIQGLTSYEKPEQTKENNG